MKSIQTIFLLAVVLWQVPSQAATWVEIGGNDEVVVFTDTESIRKTGNRVETWIKWDLTNAQDIPSSYPAKTYLAEKQLQVYDCQSRSLAVIQRVRYEASDGNLVVDSYIVDEESWKFSKVVPEIIDETSINFECKKFDPKRK